jgi:hypothetical protein
VRIKTGETYHGGTENKKVRVCRAEASLREGTPQSVAWNGSPGREEKSSFLAPQTSAQRSGAHYFYSIFNKLGIIGACRSLDQRAYKPNPIG